MIVLIITAFIASLGAISAYSPWCYHLPFPPKHPFERKLYEIGCDFMGFGWNRRFRDYTWDVDECSKPHLNNCSHTCHNTVGSYRCSCPFGYVLINDFKCVVKPIILENYSPEKRTITVDEGSRAFLQCIVTSGAEPIWYHWLKNGLPFLAHGEMSEMDGLPYSMLTFNRASLADAGRYVCVAANGASSANVTMQLIVNAVRCPSIVVPHHTIVSCYKPNNKSTNWNSGSENDIPRSDTSFFPLNTICTFKCKTGYNSSVLPGAIECQRDRKWNGTIPECT